MPSVDLASFEQQVRSLDKDRLDGTPPDDLAATARHLVADGRGLLAADESPGTAGKRFGAIGLDNTAENRRRYRQVLFAAPGLADHVSGVILYDETFWQATDDGTPFPRVLADQGMVPGVKADAGTKPLAGHQGEQVTAGLDGLRDRLAAYAADGARFTKWRAVIGIGEDQPSEGCLQANAHAMARYAAISQEAGLVPIVEPEVVMDGAHGIARDEQVTGALLRALYDQMLTQRVQLEGSILKVNMVLPGKESEEEPSDEQVAEATLRCLRAHVPAAVPGVAFLSGGQSAREATARLDAINRAGPQPWQLTFSFARALQGPAMDAWAGDDANADAAQTALVHRARCNAAAATGTYRPGMENVA